MSDLFKGIDKTIITQEDELFLIGNKLTDLYLKGAEFSLHCFINVDDRSKIETRVAALKEKQLVELVNIGVTNNDIVFFKDYTRMITERNNSYDGTLVFTDQAYQGLFYDNDNDSSLTLIVNNDVLKLEYKVTSFHDWDSSKSEWVELKIPEVDDFYLVVWTDRNQDKVVDADELGKVHIFIH